MAPGYTTRFLDDSHLSLSILSISLVSGEDGPHIKVAVVEQWCAERIHTLIGMGGYMVHAVDTLGNHRDDLV